ncbi:hypothetical protein [Bosea sp. BH3]|uniref:hypothetical protein n=1 Tax=Bosea sp. BH3 TaxID=2871701 RepID=UPI0021CB05CB|nr:hypothetical protein [Bosea sp. BH3]MCU4180112.1 hypothetical protein [Bosea sp. BH3]
MHFYRLGSIANRDGTVDGVPFDAFYGDFAKAYCRYRHSTSPVQFENQAKRLNALQFIEAAFHSLGLTPNIADCNAVILNTAVALAKSGVGDDRHYQFAIYIEQVHRFCSDHRFYNASFRWKHGIKKPKDRMQRLGEEAKAWREDRLPSPEAFGALAHVFRNAESFIDILMSSVCVICCSVPIRAHEVLQLREKCEVDTDISTARRPEEGGGAEQIDFDERGGAYGIRVWPGKGHSEQIKWVPTVMASVVRQAIGNLRRLGAAGRELAVWYEKNPTKLWLPPHIEYIRRSEWITLVELGEILGFERVSSVRQWLNGAPSIRTNSSGEPVANFRDVERHLVAMMPKDFPFFNGDPDQPYSNTLIVLRRNETHAERSTIPCVIGHCGVQTFEHWLSGHDGGKKPSVFERWGFKERDGSAIEITTHAFRHWLNTIAQLRGMSDLDIAKWSGRDPSQNPAYDHVSPEETLSRLREKIEECGGLGPMFEPTTATRINQPVSPKDFLKAQIGAAHITDFGICIHDYSLLPCPDYGDCLGCSENVFQKGDLKHREKIEQRLNLALKQLEQSGQADAIGIYGADRWTQDHLQKIERMRAILVVHEDSSIADGTVISMGASGRDNAISMAVRDRKARLGDEVEETSDVSLRNAVDDMWND